MSNNSVVTFYDNFSIIYRQKLSEIEAEKSSKINDENRF